MAGPLSHCHDQAMQAPALAHLSARTGMDREAGLPCCRKRRGQIRSPALPLPREGQPTWYRLTHLPSPENRAAQGNAPWIPAFTLSPENTEAGRGKEVNGPELTLPHDADCTQMAPLTQRPYGFGEQLKVGGRLSPQAWRLVFTAYLNQKPPLGGSTRKGRLLLSLETS